MGGEEEGREGGITKGHEETFGNDAHVHSLDCSDGSMRVYISQLIKLYTLNICTFLNVN